ncbi:MAG TPA: hypothetical protein VH392_11435 [Sphingomicrobium sp.]
MLLPIHAALGTRTAVVAALSIAIAVAAVPARTVEFRAIVTIVPGAIKFRPVAEPALALFAIPARTREARTLVRAASVVAIPPRLLVAPVAFPELAIAVALSGAALAVTKLPILKTAEGTRLVAVATWRPIAARTIIVLAESLATRGVRALVAVALPRGIWLPVAELPI